MVSVNYVSPALPGSQANPQTLLFSATCPHWVYDVAKKYMRSEYEHVDLIGKRTAKTATTVEVGHHENMSYEAPITDKSSCAPNFKGLCHP